MKPDRAHRTLNTILLVFLIGTVSLGEPAAAGFWEHVYAVGVYGSMVAIIFLGLKIAAEHVDEIREYAGLSN